jgi:hypothetical protein
MAYFTWAFLRSTLPLFFKKRSVVCRWRFADILTDKYLQIGINVNLGILCLTEAEKYLFILPGRSTQKMNYLTPVEHLE